MQQVDTIIDAKWIIPVEPSNTVLENYALVINHGRILDLLPSSDATGKYRSEERRVGKECRRECRAGWSP